MSEDVDIEQIKKLVKLVEKHNLAELTVEEDGTTITIRGVEPPAAHAEATQPAVKHAPTQEDPPGEPAAQSAPGNLVALEAPMIGIFYRAASPDSPPLVDLGDTIEVGQPIGLIEAMKVFSEIPSEVAGVVVEIPGENGKLVQQGDALVVVQVE